MKKTTTASCATIVALATFVLGHSLDMSALQYHLELTTDCWGEESSWSITDSEGAILYSQAPNTLNDLTTYDWDFELADGCYTFNMYDSYGDGMYGMLGCGANGNYMLTAGFGYTLVYMNVVNFGFEANHDFCVPYTSAPDLSDGIAAMEYYIDTDPGVGSGTPITLPPVVGDLPLAIDISSTIDLASTTAGFHLLYTRVKDQLGRWSIAERRTFYILPNISQSITAFQYFFDEDPGVNVVGNGGIIEVTPTSNFNDVVAITLSEVLPNEWHDLFIRTRDEFGRWSIAERGICVAGECLDASLSEAVAWWSFDNGEGSISDNAGNHDAFSSNGSATIGYATFDGIDDNIGTSDSDDFAFGVDDFTIEFFAYFNAPGGNMNNPSDKFIGQSDGIGNAKKWTFAFGGDQLFLRVSDGSTSQNLVQSPFAPAIKEWYHLALTCSGDVLNTYVDGVLTGSQELSGFVMPDVGSALTVGYVDWLQNGDQGFMSGYLDEMTIYHRALTAEELVEISNTGAIGKCKALSISTPQLSDVLYGAAFSQTLEAQFEVPALTWSLVSGSLPAGVTFDASGTLSGTPEEAGEFSFSAMVTDATSATAEKDFVLSVFMSLPEPQFTIFKSGTTPVPGREMDYFILLENTGTIDVAVETRELLEHWFVYTSSEPSAEFEAFMPDVYGSDNTLQIPHVLLWESELFVGESEILSYKVKLQPSVSLGTMVSGPALTNSGNYAQVCLNVAQAHLQQELTACGNILSAGYGECRHEANENYKQNLRNCFCNLIGTCDESTSSRPAQGPVDPNEKLVLAEHYIQPGALLPYVIHFENIGTIEALDVFITDTLDIDLDENSLNIISSEGASYDPLTRVLRWDLYDINLLPDSSGYVMYTCRPYADAPSGTVIHNTAGIQFEVFDIFVTNETENIIDGIAPEGVMDALPAETNFADFLISWSGTDAVGEIKYYNIFVSQDGGPYSLYISNTSDTSATFIGVNGSTYSFTCIAEDLAGNVEVQEPVAEATTFINATLNTYYEDSDEDGFGNPLVSLTAYTSSVGGYVLVNTDCNDADAMEYPGQLWHEDLDADGYGSGIFVIQCARPAGSFLIGELFEVASDCDDGDATRNPAATEICNLVDDDCDGLLNEDVLPGDFTNDGVVNTTDLLLFMGGFGCTSSCGDFDLDANNAVNTSDLLLFMGMFGSSCP